MPTDFHLTMALLSAQEEKSTRVSVLPPSSNQKFGGVPEPEFALGLPSSADTYISSTVYLILLSLFIFSTAATVCSRLLHFMHYRTSNSASVA